MNGFLSYVETGKIDEGFIHDYTYLCKKIYRRWKLPVSEEDFVGFCIEKLCNRVHFFQPEKGSISNFLFQMILNEANRIYSKNKRNVSTDLDLISSPTYVGAGDTASVDRDAKLKEDIEAFYLYALSMRVYIDKEQLKYKYQCGDLAAPVKSFMWWKLK